MDHHVFWLVFALAFLALTSSKPNQGVKEIPRVIANEGEEFVVGDEWMEMEGDDDHHQEDEMRLPTNEGTTEFPQIIVDEGEEFVVGDEWMEMEGDDDHHQEDEMRLPVRDFMNTDPEVLNSSRVFEGETHQEDEMILPVTDFMDTNPEVLNGSHVFEGDIILTPEQWRAIRERKGLASVTSRWPNGPDGNPLVPYIFTSSSLDTAAILSGLNHWMEHTCIKFEETTNTNQPHLRFIYGAGCYSYLGKLNQNGQDISIGSGCNTLGIVAHEVGHAMGFVHEQSRTDRDDYVVINLGNVLSGRENNFNKYPTSYIDDQGIEYDYTSDMHYGSAYFTANGKTTITTKDPLAQGLIGQRTGLSHRDKHLANIMYSCIDKWLTKCNVASDPCQNGGYFGADCTCVCPPGTSGSNCQTVTGDYYDEYKNECTEIVTTAGNLTSPNYPSNYPATQCVKWIKAPACCVPKITFTDFLLYGKSPYCGGNECCYFDALEIRTNVTTFGDVYCGTDITSGQSFTATSEEMILYFRAISSNIRRGWSLTLSFVEIPGCTVTTSTTPTTTTTTTPTTTPATTNRCLIQKIGTNYYWSSPGFGVRNYTENFHCGVVGSSTQAMLSVRLITFELEKRNGSSCDDSVVITLLYDRQVTLCGPLGRYVYTSPSFNFRATFSTDNALNYRGFNISFTPITTPCHQIITATAGQRRIIASPCDAYYCEYRIQAPSGYRVQVVALWTKIWESYNCYYDWLLLNGNSQRMYPKATSMIFCGMKYVYNPMTSTTNELYVAYKGSVLSGGFRLYYYITV